MDGTRDSSDGASLLSGAGQPYARAARVVLIASTALATGIGAHTLGGGGVPGGLGLVALAALCVAVAGLLALGRLRVATLVPSLGALQIVLHLGLVVLTSGSGASGAAGPGAHAMPGMPGVGPHALNTAADAAAAHMSMTMSPTMVGAHVVAILVTAVVLVAGDRAALSAVRWWSVVRPRVEAVVAGPGVAPLRTPAVEAAPGPCRAFVVARRGLGRRGPPPGLAVAA